MESRSQGILKVGQLFKQREDGEALLPQYCVGLFQHPFKEDLRELMISLYFIFFFIEKITILKLF